jgi:hypothetical protein
MAFLFMPSSKIHFDDDVYEFMKNHKEATGVSIQRFVAQAVRDAKEKAEAEQYLKDLPYTKKDDAIH